MGKCGHGFPAQFCFYPNTLETSLNVNGRNIHRAGSVCNDPIAYTQRINSLSLATLCKNKALVPNRLPMLSRHRNCQSVYLAVRNFEQDVAELLGMLPVGSVLREVLFEPRREAGKLTRRRRGLYRRLNRLPIRLRMHQPFELLELPVGERRLSHR